MNGVRRGTIAVVASAAALLGVPSAASAVVVVGSNFAVTPDAAPAVNFTITQNAQPTAATLPGTSPIGGVVVRLRIKHNGSGADPGTYNFRILSGTPPNLSTNGVPAELPTFSWPANDPPGIRTFQPSLAGVPKGIPINANDRIGVARLTGSAGQGAQMFSAAGSPGGALGSSNQPHNSGTASYLSGNNGELMLQYDVEPDGDADGFGDETQDNCVSQAGANRGCAPAATKKKCKKGRKLKKGKCVKKKRRKKK